jgi:t-SNARE complex subunit (syntaxin)
VSCKDQQILDDRCDSRCPAASSCFFLADLHLPEDEVDAKIESGELYNTVGILMAERDKKLLFEDVKSRHDDIVRLEKSIRELHELFQDMAMLVQSQVRRMFVLSCSSRRS